MTKTMTKELIDNEIICKSGSGYRINKFKLSEDYLIKNKLDHLIRVIDKELLFKSLKDENSELLKFCNSYQHSDICIICDNRTAFFSWNKGYKKYCSSECEQITRTKTKQAKTKEEKSEIVNKMKKTCLEKYGVDNPQKVKAINAKSVQTQIDKYGGTFNLAKSKETKLKRHGNENYNNAKKQQQTCIANSYIKYGVRHYSQAGIYDMSRFKLKFYELPSGQFIQIQGYEDKLLDELLKEYNENDIITERRNMPELWYIGLDDKTHRYFPDMYIPKTNSIYEVKSEWTLNINLETNILKFKSVKDAGYNFILKIY